MLLCWRAELVCYDAVRLAISVSDFSPLLHTICHSDSLRSQSMERSRYKANPQDKKAKQHTLSQ
ncbi:hypothetical protein ACIRNY_08115 [Capnocytophaga canimorsus]|uniref:hypothetical protein n=1 Tax=Capnocytophaga canimorsus TaxID=28188 RepID=UPI00384F8588